MKRLKFNKDGKKPFNGIGNALKLIPETYKVDNNFYLEHIFDVLNANIPFKYKIISETPFTQKPFINEASFYKKMRKLHGLKRFLFFD